MTGIDITDLERVYRRLKLRYGNPPPGTALYVMPGTWREILDGIDANHVEIEAECKARGWLRDDLSRCMGNDAARPIKGYAILPTVLKPWKAKSEKPERKKATVNMRMADEIQRNPDAMGWSITEWQGFLKCGRATVHESETWKNLESMRESRRAEQRTDRRRRTRLDQ